MSIILKSIDIYRRDRFSKDISHPEILQIDFDDNAKYYHNLKESHLMRRYGTKVLVGETYTDIQIYIQVNYNSKRKIYFTIEENNKITKISLADFFTLWSTIANYRKEDYISFYAYNYEKIKCFNNLEELAIYSAINRRKDDHFFTIEATILK